VALIRGFLSDPGALLIDDPFAELDVHTRVKAQQELQAL
jgi:ABC-type nitrate/sulfonate/bicarbonate transport system ATPase subunit